MAPLLPSASAASPNTDGWRWVPTLYLAESLPYAIINILAIAFFTLRGVSVEQITLWTSLLGLPWVLKPLWSPFLERTRRLPMSVAALQMAMGAVLACASFFLERPYWFAASVALFALAGFLSASHDALADGFYIRALSADRQALFSGVRNTFYRLGLLLGGSLLLILQERASNSTVFADNPDGAWGLVFQVVGALIFLLGLYHAFGLPAGAGKATMAQTAPETPDYWQVIRVFFAKPNILPMIGFMLFYRFAEALLLKVSPMFMLKPRIEGGLGLNQTQYGLVYGTVGLVALLLGGIFGGWLVSRKGLKTCLWPMALALNIPDLLYVYLACVQPESLGGIGLCVAIEQFNYGFGFTAFMVYLLYVSRGPYAIAHYALCTAFMALGLVLPGIFSGYLLKALGFPWFFTLVCAATTVSFICVKFAPLTENYGKRSLAL